MLSDRWSNCLKAKGFAGYIRVSVKLLEANRRTYVPLRLGGGGGGVGLERRYKNGNTTTAMLEAS